MSSYNQGNRPYTNHKQSLKNWDEEKLAITLIKKPEIEFKKDDFCLWHNHIKL